MHDRDYLSIIKKVTNPSIAVKAFFCGWESSQSSIKKTTAYVN